MPRAILVTVASCVLATACALVDPPPPANTVMLQVEVRNESDAPVGELGVKARSGMLQGAAQPPWVPADSTTMVTFYVPDNDEWWIALNRVGVLEGARVQRFRNERCFVEFSANRAAHFVCP